MQAVRRSRIEAVSNDRSVALKKQGVSVARLATLPGKLGRLRPNPADNSSSFTTPPYLICGWSLIHRATVPGSAPGSADRGEVVVRTLGRGVHDPLCSPVVDPRCLGGSVDRRAATSRRQHGHHRLDGLSSDSGFNQLRREVCIDLCCLGLR